MLSLQRIISLYSYNVWANQRILMTCAQLSSAQFIAANDSSWGSIRGTLVHILDSERGFRGLCQGVSTGDDLTEADLPTLDAIQSCWREEEIAMRAYLDSLRDEDLDQPIRYRSSDGVMRERFVWQVLFHILNHGMQHRSEVAAMLTREGHSPGDLDFPLYLNEQEDRA